MNAVDRKNFVEVLIGSVLHDVIVAADKMPDDWDGEELRRYVADKFEEQVNLLARGRVRANGCTKRLADYHATVILRGL